MVRVCGAGLVRDCDRGAESTGGTSTNGCADGAEFAAGARSPAVRSERADGLREACGRGRKGHRNEPAACAGGGLVVDRALWSGDGRVDSLRHGCDTGPGREPVAGGQVQQAVGLCRTVRTLCRSGWGIHRSAGEARRLSEGDRGAVGGGNGRCGHSG